MKCNNKLVYFCMVNFLFFSNRAEAYCGASRDAIAYCNEQNVGKCPTELRPGHGYGCMRRRVPLCHPARYFSPRSAPSGWKSLVCGSALNQNNLSRCLMSGISHRIGSDLAPLFGEAQVEANPLLSACEWRVEGAPLLPTPASVLGSGKRVKSFSPTMETQTPHREGAQQQPQVRVAPLILQLDYVPWLWQLLNLKEGWKQGAAPGVHAEGVAPHTTC